MSDETIAAVTNGRFSKPLVRPRFVLGDIHGCSKKLRRMVEDVLELGEHDILYLLGDYWRESSERYGTLTDYHGATTCGGRVDYNLCTTYTLAGEVARGYLRQEGKLQFLFSRCFIHSDLAGTIVCLLVVSALNRNIVTAAAFFEYF